MSTDSDLSARLRDLADDAPRAGLVAEDLWRTGVRRHRLRLAATVTGAAAAVVLVLAVTSVLRLPIDVPPAEGPAERGLPRVVEAPDPWSDPVAAPGPLSAISSAFRSSPEGLTGTVQRPAPFGVSAVDGVARFLDVPFRPVNIDDSNVALSPDGTLVAMSRYTAESSSPRAKVKLLGWDVLDIQSGELTRLRPTVMPQSGLLWRDLAFSSDSRFLVTDFSLTGDRANDASSLVAWALETGDHFVVEPAGHFWEPGRGSGPEGVVWTRQRTVRVVDPVTREQDRISMPHQLVDAAFSADGTTLAYIGHAGDRPDSRAPWRLYVRGPGAESRRIDVGISPGQILGWRDETHVVGKARCSARRTSSPGTGRTRRTWCRRR